MPKGRAASERHPFARRLPPAQCAAKWLRTGGSSSQNRGARHGPTARLSGANGTPQHGRGRAAAAEKATAAKSGRRHSARACPLAQGQRAAGAWPKRGGGSDGKQRRRCEGRRARARLPTAAPPPPPAPLRRTPRQEHSRQAPAANRGPRSPDPDRGARRPDRQIARSRPWRPRRP